MKSTVASKAAQFTLALLMTALSTPSIAVAGEFLENAMCTSVKPDAAFTKISVQTDPTNSKRGILILQASDGWTQVYSGPMHQDTKSILFREDKKVIQAIFNKDVYSASITFNQDEYVCDERSFGN